MQTFKIILTETTVGSMTENYFTVEVENAKAEQVAKIKFTYDSDTDMPKGYGFGAGVNIKLRADVTKIPTPNDEFTFLAAVCKAISASVGEEDEFITSYLDDHAIEFTL